MTIDAAPHRGTTRVVPLTGEIDIGSERAMEAAIAAAVAAGATEVVLDLREVTFMGSTGLTSMLTARQALADRGGLLVLRTPPTCVRTLLEVTGLEPLFAIEP